MNWHDLNSRQRDILTALATNSPQYHTQLADTIGVDKSTVYRNCDTLRQHGLVSGEHDHEHTGIPLEERITSEGFRVVHEGVVRRAEEIMGAELEQ